MSHSEIVRNILHSTYSDFNNLYIRPKYRYVDSGRVAKSVHSDSLYILELQSGELKFAGYYDSVIGRKMEEFVKLAEFPDTSGIRVIGTEVYSEKEKIYEVVPRDTVRGVFESVRLYQDLAPMRGAARVNHLEVVYRPTGERLDYRFTSCLSVIVRPILLRGRYLVFEGSMYRQYLDRVYVFDLMDMFDVEE